MSDIAFTADIHISEKFPARQESLKYILNYLKEKSIDTLIIAGDLLDKGYNGYREVDKLFAGFPDIEIHIIGGNHDPALKQEYFASSNVAVYDSARIVEIKGLKFLFLPYRKNAFMGEVIQEFENELSDGRWILVSHGDWGAVKRGYMPQEEGYFPLTRRDFERYRPAKVFLGHIHNADLEEDVLYPGSPYPIDKNETGLRKFVLLNPENMSIDWIKINEGRVYISQNLFVVPVADEEKYIMEKVKILKKKITEELEGTNCAVKLYLKVFGYTGWGRDKVKDLLEKEFTMDVDINSEGLEFTDNSDLIDISSQVVGILEKKELPESENKFIPDREEIINKALELLYGI